jgi:hypothetical protein
MKTLFENWNKYIVESEFEKDGTQDFNLRLPKLRISDNWGTPNSTDRRAIEQFTKNIQGNDLASKINSLNSFVADCDKACANTKDVAEILGNLIFLEALASVIYDFNPQTGGFLFEALLSALFGGKAQQIPTGTTGKDQDVVDVIDDKGRELSVKFFYGGDSKESGGSQYIGGSFPNLRKRIVDKGAPITYLIGVKERAGKGGNVLNVSFYEFTVGSIADGIQGDFDVIQVGKMTAKQWAGKESKEGEKTSLGLKDDESLNAALKQMGRFNEEGNIIINKNGLSVNAIKNDQYKIASLKLGSQEDVKKVAQNYADRLGSVLYNIYNQIDALSQNVNGYFLDNDSNAARAAQQNAIQLRKDTEDLT